VDNSRLKESFVDFENAVVGALARRSTHVAICFPRLSLHLRGSHHGEVAPVVEAEIRVWDGVVEQSPRRLPRRLARWEITWRGSVRNSVLPLGFAASGRVRLIIEFPRDEPLMVVGSRATLQIFKRQSQLAPGPAKKLRPDRRRPPSSVKRPC
jgi:hypothetical protein